MVQRITIKPSQHQGMQIALESDQVHYLHRVLRLQAGDRFIAQDGKGQQWLAALNASLTEADVVEVLSTAEKPLSTAPLRLVAALPKGNSFDQVVRQATELGVTHIYPVMSDRSLLKPSKNKLARWQRIAAEASEQSERITVPDIFEPIGFSTLLNSTDFAQIASHDLCYLCATRQDSPHLLSKIQIDLMSGDSLGVILMVGPEGGWTSNEITDAIASGCKVVSLGSVILRSVTASITALSLVAAARELLI